MRIQTADFVGAVPAVKTTVTSVVVVDTFAASTSELIGVRTS